MPCILRTLHNTNGYYDKKPYCARSRPVARDNPGIVADSPRDVAFIALLIVFFALLGTAVVLAAVYFSKRKLDRECKRAGSVRVQSRLAPKDVQTSSAHSINSRSSIGSAGSELSQLQQSDDVASRRTLRGRRGMPELSVRYDNGHENWVPRFPEPTHRSQPSAVFPGVRYGMGQIGNDGKVHRPESIFEHLRP